MAPTLISVAVTPGAVEGAAVPELPVEDPLDDVLPDWAFPVEPLLPHAAAATVNEPVRMAAATLPPICMPNPCLCVADARIRRCTTQGRSNDPPGKRRMPRIAYVLAAMPVFFSDAEYAVIRAMCARLIPTDQDPGATEAGVVDYIDTFLGAFSFDPPRIWAGGPFSGRRGGEASFGRFTPLTPPQELAWRTRIEGSLGIPEREFNGPVVGLQERYREGLQAVGEDFAGLPAEEQDERLRAHPEFTQLVYEHACEGMYGAPEYGGNRDEVGWRYIGFEGDAQPAGYTDAEVSEP